MAELTDKQKRFCEEYLTDLNATQAAIRAGYSEKTAHSIGHENLIKPEIQEYIQERQKQLQNRLNITQERVLQELAKIAFVDIREVFGPDNQLHDIRQLDDDTAAALASVKSNEIVREGMVIGETKEVKFHNKISALDLLGKHLGLYEKDNSQKKSEVNVSALSDDVINALLNASK